MLVASRPFAEWWEKIQARLGNSFEGEALLYFSDNQLGEHKASRPPSIAYELGADDYTSNGTGARRGPNARPIADTLYINETQLVFHVWGKDPDQTHEMRRALIAALWDIGHQSYRPSNGTWNTREVDGLGSTYVFSVTLRIPITRDPETTAVITGFDQSDYGIQPLATGDDS